MKIIAFIIAAFISLPAAAQAYIEVGIGAVIDNRSYHCISDYRNPYTRSHDCSDNPLGSIAAGYMYEGFSLEIEHKSSLVEKDRGLDTVFVKYRYTFD